MKNLTLMLSLSAALNAGLAVANPYIPGTDNDPKFIIENANKNFESLPTFAELSQEKTPWASSFWPHVYSGIAFRWNSFYEGEPTFAPLHYQVDEIDEKIEDLETQLFVSPHSVEENKEIVAEVIRLKNEKLKVNAEKATYYKKYFFDLERPTKTRYLGKLSQEEMDSLSPAEKYDAYMYLKTGKENKFNLTSDVLRQTQPYDAYWEGICHGWTSAALEFKEPKPQSITKNGITVNFGSSDLKALLSYYHAAITRSWVTNKKVITGRVGERCGTAFSKHAWFIKDGVEYYKSIEDGVVKINEVPEDCVDTNPGSFHIVLANMIGLKDQGFSAEVVRDKEVWNQPVYKYDTKVISESSQARPWASPNTAKQVEVKTVMYYANDGGRMFWRHDGTDDEFYAWWDQTTGTSNYRFDHKEFHYYLDLDASGNIIGGQWLSYERPDFLWLKKTKGFLPKGTFFGIVNYLRDLQDLVELQ